MQLPYFIFETTSSGKCQVLGILISNIGQKYVHPDKDGMANL